MVHGEQIITETLAALTPDGTETLLRGCKEADISKCKGFFNN